MLLKTIVQWRRRRAAAKPRSKGRPGLALSLELLEERTVPATFPIANGDVSGLIAAIHTADGNGQDNTIVLARGGSYVLGAADNANDGPTGLPVIATADHTRVVKPDFADALIKWLPFIMNSLA
jgi:hypothetical protein